MTPAELLVAPGAAADAAVFVGGLATDPVTDETVVYVLRAPGAALADPATPARLAADRRIGTAAEVVLRTEPGQAVSWPGVRLEQRYITADPVALGPAGPSGHGYLVEPAGPSTREFVQGLLVRAIVDGYAEVGYPLPARRAREIVEATYPVGEPGLLSFVARTPAGEPAGHVTLCPDETDELTGEAFCEVVDMFVLEAFRGSACSRALMARALAAGAGLGQRLIGHVVWNDTDAATVYARLTAQGWTPYYDLWRAPLPSAGPVPA